METLNNYRILTLTCFENAVALIEDAKLLVKKGTPGHAQALAVLAFEEWSKYIASFWLLMGWIKKEDKDFQFFFKTHSHKHKSALSFMFLSVFLQWAKKSEISHKTFAGVDEYLNMSLEEKFDDFLNLLRKDTHPLADNILTILDLELILEENKKFFSIKKESGLYVDFNFATERILNPLDIKSKDADSLIKSFHDIIEGSKHIYKALKGDKKFDSLRKQIFDHARFSREPLEVINFGIWEDFKRRYRETLIKVDKRLEFSADKSFLELKVILQCTSVGENGIYDYGIVDFIPRGFEITNEDEEFQEYASQEKFPLEDGYIVKWMFDEIQPGREFEIHYKLRSMVFNS